MLCIPDAQVDRAIHIIDTSGAAELLEETMAFAPQGRKRMLTLRAWLIGAYLAIEADRSFKSTTIHEVLTRGISLHKQRELGVRTVGPRGTTTISKAMVDRMALLLRDRLSYTPAAATQWRLDIDPADMAGRRTALEQAMNRILDASVIYTAPSSWYALDGSNYWSWGRAKKFLADDKDVRAQEEVVDDPSPAAQDGEGSARVDHQPEDAAGNGTSCGADGEGTQRKHRRSAYDPEAAIGSRTAKGGTRESFFGYMIDAAVRVPHGSGPQLPPIVERLLLSPANADVVEPSLKLLDSLSDTPGGVTDIVVDRHYSYKKVDRWADPLRMRKINQHFDLRVNEQGFRDVNGARMAAGVLHCPATPDELGVINRPALNASADEWAVFNERVARRQAYALDRHETIDAAGRCRGGCPALGGKLGCELRPGTVEVARQAGLPIVTNPPDPATAPPACTQKTVSDRSDETRKHYQPHYWGSREWQQVYNLRTYVEGAFGSLKNGDTEGVRRGHTKFVGLVMLTIGLVLGAASLNVRHQRNHWADDPDRPDHPLLTPDPEFYGWALLTAEQAAMLDADYDGGTKAA